MESALFSFVRYLCDYVITLHLPFYLSNKLNDLYVILSFFHRQNLNAVFSNCVYQRQSLLHMFPFLIFYIKVSYDLRLVKELQRMGTIEQNSELSKRKSANVGEDTSEDVEMSSVAEDDDGPFSINGNKLRGGLTEKNVLKATVTELYYLVCFLFFSKNVKGFKHISH